MRIEHKSTAQKIDTCCSLLGYTRQAYYQSKRHEEKRVLYEELLIQKVLTERTIQKRLGGRKLFFLLQDFMKEHGITQGRDAFFSLLSGHGLLIRRRKRKAITTNSNHRFKKYPNLIREFVPVLPHQLWVSDITYIVIGKGFGYLSLITDAYSRKIVGFYLSRDLSAKGCIAALKMGLDSNRDFKNLIHHSDRGMQYCCHEYVKLLQGREIKISMTENGDPLENAIAERVNGILKEELLEPAYPCFDSAKQAVAEAVCIYNHHRPHSSVSNYTPQEAHYLEDIQIKRLWKSYYKLKKKEGQIQVV
jgi:putative transposase